MGITYEEIKANGNSVVVERQENLVIEQNSRNFFKHRQSLIKKKFARFSPSVAEKLIKRQETQEEIKRDGKSTNGACKAEKNADETGTETEAEVQLNNIIKEAVNTWVLKKKKSQQICDSVEKAYQQLCSLEHAINNEIEKLKQQRRVLRMGITSGLRLPERKNTYVQQNEDSSGKCDYSAKTLDEIIVEKFSNKHKFSCTSPHCQSEKIIASRPCTRTVSSQINSSKSIKTDRGALGDHKSLNKLIGKDYKDSKRSYELAEETSTDLKRNSQEKRLSNIKNFLTSPENMDLKDKKDQIVNICYGAAGGNGFYNNSISKPNNYTSKYYNASSRYDNNGVYNQSCYHENCFSSNGYGYTYLRDHFQEARGRARAKVKGKHQTKDISDASCEEYVFFKKKECSEYCKDQERERDKMERKFCDESAEAFNQKLPQASCSNLSELLDRCAEEGIKWGGRTKRDCINEKSAKREESTSSSSCTKVRSRRRICEITFTKRKPRTRSLSPIQTCTSCCLCPEYFMDETQCCEIPLSCHKRPEPEYSFETLCMLKKMKITEYKPSKPKNNGKDKQYNNYINKYEKEQEQESLRKQPSLSPKRNTLETTPNYNLLESPGYQSPVKSPPESKRISTRRSRNGESPIRTPAPTPSPVFTPPIRTPAPTPSPVPTPPIRTPAPTPPPVPTAPIRTPAPAPSSVFTPPIHTPTPAASPVPTAIFEPIPAHTSVSKPTPIPTPIPSPFLTPISTPIRRSVYEEPSPQRIEKLATPPTLSVIPAIASPKQPENFVASETSYHSTNSDDKDTESKVDQVAGRTTALEDLNTTKIRSKECIRIKECIAEDGTQITQIVRHLSIEEIFNPNNDQDNMESNNNNGTPTTSSSVQDLVAHLKNFLAAFQKQCVDVQCLQRLGATLVEALSKIDLCKGGDKVKIMKTIETQYIESEIYDVPNCMSTIPYAASTEITMENHQNVEDFPQCSRGDRENREVNLQTLSVHDENKFVDCCCEQDYSEDKAYDNWRDVDQRGSLMLTILAIAL
ncbi:hypothetical protein GQX74_014613 [Glossina fuscipes]|nr:hypothetical protein GQX74_014613 [Glossina fuscipes]